MSSESLKFDIFLSHNGQDKSVVKLLGNALKRHRLTVWLDEWEIRPGLPWQKDLEKIITECKSAAVCIGASGIGPWEAPEIDALLRRLVREKKSGNHVPVIPVMLPGAPENVELPVFLEALKWVDLRQGITPEGIEQLRWGITGEKLREGVPTVCLAKVTPDLEGTRETVARYLASMQLNVLPAKAYPLDPLRFLTAFEADLAQADLFVQILGETCSQRTDELPEGEELAQFNRAQSRGKSVLQWRNKSVDLSRIKDDRHSKLVGGEKVICNDLTEFEMLVVETARQLHADGQPVANSGDRLRWTLVKADRPDRDVADEVSAKLKSTDFQCRLTHKDRSIVDWLRVVPFDAVLIVYGNCSDEWLEQCGDELMAVDLNLKDQAPVQAYYICTDAAAVPYRSKGVLEVKRRDPASWQQLMTKIQQRGAKP